MKVSYFNYILTRYFYNEKKVLYFQKQSFKTSAANIRLLLILHKTPSRPLFKRVCMLKWAYLN